MCYENRYNRAKSRIIRAEFIYLGDFNELSHYHKENRYSESVQLHITTNNQEGNYLKNLSLMDQIKHIFFR